MHIEFLVKATKVLKVVFFVPRHGKFIILRSDFFHYSYRNQYLLNILKFVPKPKYILTSFSHTISIGTELPPLLVQSAASIGTTERRLYWYIRAPHLWYRVAASIGTKVPSLLVQRCKGTIAGLGYLEVGRNAMYKFPLRQWICDRTFILKDRMNNNSA